MAREKKGRIVNVIDTGEKGNTLNLFKAPNGKWFSSEDAYLKWDMDKTFRNMCIEEVRKQLNYEEFMKLDTLFLKKLQEWKPFGYDVVYNCIKSQANGVEWAINNKSFSNEKAKVQYVSVIYQNHMVDAYKDKQRRLKAEQKRRKDAVEIEEKTIDLSKVGVKNKKGKDVSSLLGDENWI